MQDILYLIELILNVQTFIDYKQKDFEKRVYEHFDRNVSLIKKKSNMLSENVEILLEELGYKKINVEEYKVNLIKDDADVINTAISVKDEDISTIILNYNDFRIENNLSAKKDILVSLGQYLEPYRKELKNKSSDLEDYIFFCLNKLHIRHNNKSGKKSNEYIAIMKDDELINWYDKVYSFILIAIRLIELPEQFKDFKKLKSKIIEADALFKDNK